MLLYFSSRFFKFTAASLIYCGVTWTSSHRSNLYPRRSTLLSHFRCAFASYLAYWTEKRPKYFLLLFLVCRLKELEWRRGYLQRWSTQACAHGWATINRKSWRQCWSWWPDWNLSKECIAIITANYKQNANTFNFGHFHKRPRCQINWTA